MEREDDVLQLQITVRLESGEDLFEIYVGKLFYN